MKDIQNSQDNRGISLTKVGVVNVKRRITVKRRRHTYEFLTNMNIYVNLDSDMRGANLSRFLRALENVSQNTTSVEKYIKDVALMCRQMHKSDCLIEINSMFPYEKQRLDKKYEEHVYPLYLSYDTKKDIFVMKTSAIGMSYCPCAKEMCGGPSHNQRAITEVTIKTRSPIKSGEVIDAINNAFSVPVFHVLKRPEEKAVVMKALENPKFSEDCVKDTIINLRKNKSLTNCYVIVSTRTEESIHPHDVLSEWEGIL